jgi:hypothetical protein
VSQLDTGVQRLNTQLTRQIDAARNALAEELGRQSQAAATLARRVSALEQSGQNVSGLLERVVGLERGLGALTTRVNNYHQAVNVR